MLESVKESGYVSGYNPLIFDPVHQSSQPVQASPLIVDYPFPGLPTIQVLQTLKSWTAMSLLARTYTIPLMSDW